MISMFVYMAHSPAWPVEAFRALIERILDETDLPQAGLAALVPMDPSQLSRWKSGSSRPKFESLVALGETLKAKYPHVGVGPNELLESAGYAPPEATARVAQAHLHAPGGSVVISSGGSSRSIPIAANEPEPDPRELFDPELDEYEAMIWAMRSRPWPARVAAIEAMRAGIAVERKARAAKRRQGQHPGSSPDIGQASSGG